MPSSRVLLFPQTFRPTFPVITCNFLSIRLPMFVAHPICILQTFSDALGPVGIGNIWKFPTYYLSHVAIIKARISNASLAVVSAIRWRRGWRCFWSPERVWNAGTAIERAASNFIAVAVDIKHRITQGVVIRVRVTAHQPDRIALDVPPDGRIVIPMPVLGELGFAVPVLAGEAEQHGERAADAGGVAEGIEHPVPIQIGRLVGQLLRPAEMVGVGGVDI